MSKCFFVPFVHKKDFINRSERAFWLVSNLLKVFFILTDQQKDKQELFIPNVSERHDKKDLCVFFKINYIGREVDDEASSVLSPEKFWVISKALEFFCRGFVTSALMSSLLMSLALLVSWKEAVPQKKLKRIKNAKRKISRD